MGSQLLEKIQGKTVRGKIHRMLIVLFAVMLLTTAGYLAYSQSVLVEGLVERQTKDLADSYFDNINTLMLTGGMANRDIPRQKLMARPEVVEARIMRGPAVTKFFGPGAITRQRSISSISAHWPVSRSARFVTRTMAGC